MTRTLLLLLPLFAACSEEQRLSRSAEVVTGECSGSAFRSDGPDGAFADTGTAAEPGVEAEVVEGSLVLHYVDMAANCCPSPGASIELTDTTVRVDLSDVTSDEACDCMCVTDFDVTVPDLDPGAWTVEALFNGSLVATLDATI